MDTEDDVYLEFEDEDEPVKQEEEAPATWQLIARYMANFKPNTKAMFTRFTEEVWHLRSRIDYAEKGKNYYMITLHSKGDYDFVKKGGPWIFKKHALIIKDFDKSMQPSDIKLGKVPCGLGYIMCLLRSKTRYGVEGMVMVWERRLKSMCLNLS
jgi:hypothetical protein